MSAHKQRALQGCVLFQQLAKRPGTSPENSSGVKYRLKAMHVFEIFVQLIHCSLLKTNLLDNSPSVSAGSCPPDPRPPCSEILTAGFLYTDLSVDLSEVHTVKGASSKPQGTGPQSPGQVSECTEGCRKMPFCGS